MPFLSGFCQKSPRAEMPPAFCSVSDAPQKCFPPFRQSSFLSFVDQFVRHDSRLPPGVGGEFESVVEFPERDLGHAFSRLADGVELAVFGKRSFQTDRRLTDAEKVRIGPCSMRSMTIMVELIALRRPFVPGGFDIGDMKDEDPAAFHQRLVIGRTGEDSREGRISGYPEKGALVVHVPVLTQAFAPFGDGAEEIPGRMECDLSTRRANPAVAVDSAAGVNPDLSELPA